MGRHLIESEGHLILVVCPSFVYDSICPLGCSQQSWPLRVSYLSLLRTHLHLSSVGFFSISGISRVCVFWKWGFDVFFEPFLSSLTWVALHFDNQRQGRSRIHFSTGTQTFPSMRDVGNCFGREHSPLKNQKLLQYFRQFITAVSRRGFYRHVWRSLHCCNIQHYIRLQRAVGKWERLSFPWTSEWLLYYASGEWQS